MILTMYSQHHYGSCNPWVTGRREYGRLTIRRKRSENQISSPELNPKDDLLFWAFKGDAENLWDTVNNEQET